MLEIYKLQPSIQALWQGLTQPIDFYEESITLKNVISFLDADRIQTNL